MKRAILNSRRSRTSCSLIALATVLAVGASPASAQSLLGSGTYVTNPAAGGITTPNATTTNIALNGGQTIIDWVPTDNAVGTGTNILFQPAATTANYNGTANFAVLNRVMVNDATRAIVMNGTVNSFVNGVQGGSVYFYSPSGFIFGGTSVFNVGSLVVTALPIAVDGSGNFISNFGTDNRVTFAQATNPNAAISSNGTIVANIPAFGVGGVAGNSYVAMVAPLVTHNGSISVNGSAALVAAEAATISFSADGLFDIEVTVGSTSTSGIEVYGDITGPTPAGSTDKQGIYLVAVPKNDAMTMVIGNGADLGFTLANSAVDDNGVIVLSAGHDIVDGAIGARSAGHGAIAAGNFWFTGAHTTNNLFGEATGDAFLYSVSPNLTTTFDNDVTVHAAGNVSMSSSSLGGSLTVAGNVSLSADRTGTAGQSVTAGNVSLFAQNGGTLSIAGTTDLSADAIGGVASSGTAGSGTGGTVSIWAADGSTLSLSSLTTSATGTGGSGLVSGVHAGSGTGGSLTIFANNGGVLNMSSPLLLDAQGYGGSASGAGLAGNGTGGNASILAGNNGALTFTGNVLLDADGFGGSHSTGAGGAGTGGVAQTDLLNNATLLVTGNLVLSASGTGGAGGNQGPTGGIGQGGIANIGADYGPSSGSTMSVSGNTSVLADGYGGAANGAGGRGGNAIGGDAFMGGSTNSYAFNGNLTVSASAQGGASQSGLGGSADGGTAALDSTGANVHVGNTVSILADGIGGDGASGGDGSGGFARVRSQNINIVGAAFLSASGSGGYGYDGDGGDGFGGTSQLQAQNGSVSIGGSVFANADGNGGGSENSGSHSGNGFGGTATIQALSNGNLGITGGLLASADGFGGGVFGFGTNGGNGTGGYAYLQAFGANAVVTLGGSADVTANGNGGELCGECGAGGIGGHGVGGQVTVQAFGANTANLAVAGSLTAEANGQGGDGVTGDGGEGEGGAIYIGANDGADLHVNWGLFASATGEGGYSFGPGDGGVGSGGEVTLAATSGGTLEIDGGGYLDADGYGGGAGIGSSGDGGEGFGGVVEVYANGGAVDIEFLLSASADGVGGYSENGSGGDGTGGWASAFALAGTIEIDGNLYLSAYGMGGDAETGQGGDGFGNYAELGVDGGDIIVSGSAYLDASGHGGNGTIGGHGDGGGDPEVIGDSGAVIFARVGEIAIAGTADLDASGFGGDGAAGGDGGIGTGGVAIIESWGFQPAAISANLVVMSADGHGGDGGAGLDANDGGNGGNGGIGVGGRIGLNGSAAGGFLDVGASTLSAQAFGGDGGDGGNGDSGSGGNGGAGGSATAGRIQVGTVSHDLSIATGGGATFSTVVADASALGGNGGDGGTGGGGDGAGGDGGAATGGLSMFLVRGVLVTADTVHLAANATGGNGGNGETQGNGGDATTGAVMVESKDRFNHPTQRGTLVANAIIGDAVATGGLGAVNGAGVTTGGSFFRVLNGDANIGSVNFQIAGDLYDGASGPDYIQAQDGTATIGSFAFDTTGELAVYTTNTGTLNVGTLTLMAGNFIDHPTLVGPTSPGTIFADNVIISTGGDFVADANWDVTNTFVVDAPGSIILDNVHDDNGIDFSAGGTINIATIDAGTYVDLLAGGSIATDDISAGTTVRVQSTAGSIAFPTIDAGGNVTLLGGTSVSGMDVTSGGDLFARSFGGDLSFANLDSAGSIQLYSSEDVLVGGNITSGGSLTSLAGGVFDANLINTGGSVDIGTTGGISVDHLVAGETINFETGGTLTTGNLTAGDSVLGQAMGAINVGAVSAGIVDPSTAEGAEYRVSFASAANITTGTVTAAGNIGFGTPANLVTGNLDAGGGIMALIGGDISLPTVNAGEYVFLADHSMAALGGDFETFDRSAVLAAEPVLTGGAIAISGPLTASTFVTAAAGTNLNFTTIGAGGYVDLQAGNNITGTSITAGNNISLHAILGDISLGSATSSFASITMDAGDDIDLTGDLFADGDILLTAAGLIDMNNATGGFFRADALGGTFTADNITSDADIRIFAEDDVTAGDLSAGLPVESSKALRIDTNGSVVVGNMVALGGIDVTADGSVTGLNVTTGDVLITEADGAITYGNISAGLVNPQPATEPASVVLDSATSITVGNVDAAGTVGFITSGTLTAGDVTTGADLLALVHGNMTIGDIDAVGRVLLADSSMFTDAGGAVGNFGDDEVDIESIFAATPVATNGSITTANVLAGSFTAAAGTSLTTGIIDSDSEIGLGATGAITTGNLFAGAFVLANGGSITTGNIDADSVDMTSTGGNITTGDIFAFGDVELDAFGDIFAGNITAGSIDLLAGNDIATGNIDSIDGVYADAGGSLSTGTINAVDFVDINSGGNMTTGNIDAGGDLFADADGTMTLGALSGFDIELESGGNMTFVSANADTEFDFSSGGAVNGGNVTAGNGIYGDAAGTVTLANLTVSGPPEESEDFSIGIAAAGNITVGNVSGFAPVGFATLGNLTTGNVAAGDLFLAMAGGSISINGSITTSGEGGGRVYMADDSMFFTGGGTIDGDGDFDPSIVLALDPVMTGGSIAINGPVNTGLFDAAAGTSLTTQAITASGDIHARAGGTATLDGVWNSGGEVNLVSNDIEIAGTGGIAADGDLTLVSTNATQALIGDGLTGTGYALSNAEFGRLEGSSVYILARGDASAAQDMLIGNLTVTGPSAGSTIESPEGILVFGVGDFQSETVSGVIRVNGNVAATGFGSSNAIEFYADRFELDAATGSVSILSSGSTLGGELGIYANRIHVAAGSILDQLAVNPTYTNYQQDLNQPAAVQRPEGVLRADTLWIESDNLQSVLIQNTGSSAVPAGFLVREAYINDDDEVAGPPGSINLVVNGQVVTEGGTLTGVAARDALIDEETDITPFTANSTINGCPLTGQCIIMPPAPPPTSNLVQNQIDLIGRNPISDNEFDDNQEGEEGSSNPIAPPQPLFDTRPLVPSGDVNDPVSGTGNPALTGGEAQCEEDEDGQCPAPVDGGSQ